MLNQGSYIIYYQTYVSVAKWPYKEYTPKLAEESGLIYDGRPVTYSNWNLNYLSSLNDTVLQNTLNLNREHSGKGFAKVLCVKLWAHWHLSKEFTRRRVFKKNLNFISGKHFFQGHVCQEDD